MAMMISLYCDEEGMLVFLVFSYAGYVEILL